jgi:predicted amidohydrolase
MRIALAQLTSTPEPKDNLSLVADYTARAADAGARVVVFPEATMACFGVPLGGLAEELYGPWAQAVREVAAQHGVVIIAGMFTPADGGRVRNTLLITGPDRHDGYEKIHLYDAFGFTESRTVAPGDKPVTTTVDGLTLGVATCYDVRFPALFTALAARGAQAIALPSSWGAGEGKRDEWELLVRARALDSTSWVLAAAQADPRESGIEPSRKAPTGIGYSSIVGPHGRIIAQAGPAPELLVGDIDAEQVTETREKLPVLANQRSF